MSTKSKQTNNNEETWSDIVDVIKLDTDINGNSIVKSDDASIDAPIVVEAVEIIKGNVYRPNKTAKAVLDRAVSATELSVNDILNIAMMLLQDASPVEITRALTAVQDDKAKSLFNSLK